MAIPHKRRRRASHCPLRIRAGTWAGIPQGISGRLPRIFADGWLFRIAIRVGCWAHARRKFDEALRAVPKGKRSPTAEQGVAYCSQLFKLEEKLKDLSPEERKAQRQEQVKVLDAMLAWANTRNAAPKSKLGIALNYVKNQWPTLIVYLEDGRIELSNNRAERSIKPFVISRKNFLFANTPGGAKSSAVIFSLIETAKENGLDPYRMPRRCAGLIQLNRRPHFGARILRAPFLFRLTLTTVFCMAEASLLCKLIRAAGLLNVKDTPPGRRVLSQYLPSRSF